MTNTKSSGIDDQAQYIAFMLDEMLLGIDVMLFRKTTRYSEPANIPDTDEYVKGVIHLRGEVVTLIDLRSQLDFSPAEITPKTRTIVVDLNEERIALLVDEVRDVRTVDRDELKPVPANFQQTNREAFSHVVTTENRLMAILDVRKVLLASSKS